MRLPELFARNGARTTIMVDPDGIWRVDCAPYGDDADSPWMLSLSCVETRSVTGDPYWHYQEEVYCVDLDEGLRCYHGVLGTWPKFVELLAAEQAKPRHQRRSTDLIARDLALVYRAITET